MDAYKQLSLELAGIEKILKSYSGNSSAYNILPNLKEAMTTGDKDAILYCLDVIIDWYVFIVILNFVFQLILCFSFVYFFGWMISFYFMHMSSVFTVFVAVLRF